jgi:ATP-dependent helicase/nuclease subunit B
MLTTDSRVFSIPASAPFLPTLISALADGRLVAGFPAKGDPLALAGATLYLPTRRACRLARNVFLDMLAGDAAILPRIVAIGDVDEDEIAFADAATGDLAAAALELPPALGGFERKALLAELILKWAVSPRMRGSGGASLVAHSPAAAFALASDLAHLMDDMTTRQVPWESLDGLVPGDLDEYWQHTLEFLRIARAEWPAILVERGAIEPAERRDKLIAAEAARLGKSDGPVIAAGSTGSMPATAALLTAIAKLPHGAVVLPGLDIDLEQAAWDSIAGGADGEPAYGHPQFAMQALLRRIGIARDEVKPLSVAPHGRERLVSEALRPAAATDHWQQRLSQSDFANHVDAALAGITVIEAANAEDEALAIAVALREAVETPGKTAALITPDRALARRVLAGLTRWNVAVDDSGGDALADTPAGVFARLVAKAALERLAPVTLLALLKHPLCRLDMRAVAVLEGAVLRGPRPRAGTAGLAHALATLRDSRAKLHRSDPRARISEAELAAADDLVRRLAAALAPLETLGAAPRPFAEIAACHREVIATLGDETEELARAFDDIATAGRLPIRPSDYPELFAAAIADRVVRRAEADVRVRIFGPLEARLQTVDRVVLGGLVEGVWPPETRSDPWLSRPMRHALALDLPERRIGLSAHDFAQALGTQEVFLTRATRLAGAPTVASRFVQRLAAVAGDSKWKQALQRGSSYLEMARSLDAPAQEARPIERPRPKPPVAARPTQLSVTEIEHWLRDPYTIYAKHILRLRPLDAVDTPPGAADRGTVIHGAVGDFTEAYAQRLPDDPVAELERLGREHFAPLEDYPAARAFWWPRFLRIARWLVSFESRRRAALTALHAEIKGELEIPLGDTRFKLTVRADRIEQRSDGRYAILDYKTGAPPTEKQVRAGLSPQLTLEAAIMKCGGFPGIAAGGSVAELVYVRLRGGERAGEECVINFEEGTPDSQADRALARLTGVAARFAQEATPYLSLVHPMWKTRYGDYDHLARVKEWSLTSGLDDSLDL